MVFWIVNYIGMLAVCVSTYLISLGFTLCLQNFRMPCSALALESLITLLTVRGIPFFMLLWIIGTFLSSTAFPRVKSNRPL
jgi:hypothetical protein